jgi:hypothetical protein
MPLALYPLMLSPGAIGQVYNMKDQPLIPVGGTAPFTWVVTGNLPIGLDLNTAIGGTGKTSAVIEGTPRVADQYNYKPTTAIPFIVNPSIFTITVTDSSIPAKTTAQEYTMPIGVFSERQAISIYELLDAAYGFDYYVVMNDMGSREIRIGDIGTAAFGGLRLVTNALLSQFTQGMIDVMLGHIFLWDKIKDVHINQRGGSVSDITGLNSEISERKAALIKRFKNLLPAYTLAEVKARQAHGGGMDFTNTKGGGAGGGSYTEYVR